MSRASVRLLSAYTASKHGIGGLTKNAAVEYADHGIRVNAVCPGAIMTPLMSNESPERQEQILRPQAMSRFGDPTEVAAVVVWLCSDEASFVTGVEMPVDAGSVERVEAAGIRCRAVPLMMSDLDATARMAREALALAEEVRGA